MKLNIYILGIVAVIIFCGGCTNTRYLTDHTSIERQHDMRKHRAGVNIGDVFVNTASLFLSIILNTTFEASQSDRAFKRMTLINVSPDSLYVNMVTDIVWKESGYCDIMGIELPSGARQKLLVPYPAAYNVFFKSSSSKEEKMEIRTDNSQKKIRLKSGMTIYTSVNQE